MRNRLLPIFCLTVFMCAAAAAPARANAMLDFTQGANPGGTISYAGGLAPLVGTDIPIYDVTGLGSVANPGEHAVLLGVLNFVTGAFQGTFGGSDFFDAGGSFTLRGNIPDAGISAPGGALLASGTFTQATQLNLTNFNQLSAAGVDYKNPAMVYYFGLPLSATWLFSITTNENGGLPLDDNGNPLDGGSPFSVTANNTSILNVTESNGIVPEPASLLLLGTGLSVLGSVIRRGKRKPV